MTIFLHEIDHSDNPFVHSHLSFYFVCTFYIIIGALLYVLLVIFLIRILIRIDIITRSILMTFQMSQFVLNLV